MAVGQCPCYLCTLVCEVAAPTQVCFQEERGRGGEAEHAPILCCTVDPYRTTQGAKHKTESAGDMHSAGLFSSF